MPMATDLPRGPRGRSRSVWSSYRPSLSVNVNFPHAQGLTALVLRHPSISVGCHINPIVGRPVLDPKRVPSLVDERGEFFYKSFSRRFLKGQVRIRELRAEMEAQIQRVRDLAGDAFSHLDFHKSMNRLPGLHSLFLDVAASSGVGRIRTHRNLVGMENRFPRAQRLLYLLGSARRIPSLLWNAWLRREAVARGLAQPDEWVGITHLGTRPNTISVKNYVAMLGNSHPGSASSWRIPALWMTSCVAGRRTSHSANRSARCCSIRRFDQRSEASDVRLFGYRDIPLRKSVASTATPGHFIG